MRLRTAHPIAPPSSSAALGSRKPREPPRAGYNNSNGNSHNNGNGGGPNGSNSGSGAPLHPIGGYSTLGYYAPLLLKEHLALKNGNDPIRIRLLLELHADNRGKKWLVLDLDKTLLHSSFGAVPGADFVIWFRCVCLSMTSFRFIRSHRNIFRIFENIILQKILSRWAGVP
jgi:hypothetical protein